MGVDTSKWTLSDYKANAPATGLSPSNFVASQFESLALSTAQNHVPTKAPSTFPVACQASLVCRGIIYFKNTPGDCGSPTQIDLSDASIAGSVGNIATGIASMAGATLPGIGPAVQALQQIFAAHAQAVANEQATICKVSQLINQVIPYYDQFVKRGLISPSTAYAGMQTYLNQAASLLATIEKSCNASCVYTAILQAHSDFVKSYYPQIAPLGGATHAPGAPPATPSKGPGQVILSGSVGAPVASPEMVEDYFGNEVAVGQPFFAAAGSQILPGVTGDYFTPDQLAKSNPWGLVASSPISDGQYAQIVAAGGVPLKRATSHTTLILIAVVVAVVLYLVTRKSNA